MAGFFMASRAHLSPSVPQTFALLFDFHPEYLINH